MRAAPPVDVGLGSGRREQAACAVIWALAGAAMAGWLAARIGWSWSAAWVVVGAAAGAACGWAAARPMRGQLRWNGSRWTWRPAGGDRDIELRSVRVVLDFGGWLLLRGEAGRWCGVAERDVPVAWHGLRVALHSTAGERPPMPAP